MKAKDLKQGQRFHFGIGRSGDNLNPPVPLVVLLPPQPPRPNSNRLQLITRQDDGYIDVMTALPDDELTALEGVE